MDAALTTAIDAMVDAVVALFVSNVPVVLVFVGSLIGLGLMYKLVKKFVGRKVV